MPKQLPAFFAGMGRGQRAFDRKEVLAVGFGKGMAEKLDLPKEVVLDLPLVSMVGQDEVTVENHKGLLEYSAETIRIATGAGRLLLTGEGLELKQMSAACIVVKGRIFRLEFLR